MTSELSPIGWDYNYWIYRHKRRKCVALNFLLHKRGPFTFSPSLSLSLPPALSLSPAFKRALFHTFSLFYSFFQHLFPVYNDRPLN